MKYNYVWTFWQELAIMESKELFFSKYRFFWGITYRSSYKEANKQMVMQFTLAATFQKNGYYYTYLRDYYYYLPA